MFHRNLFGWVLLLVVAAIGSCQNGYPPPNIWQIYKLAKPIQPELCYSFCETCQSQVGEYQTCITCQRPFMKTIPPICNASSSYLMEAWELWEHQVNSGPGNLPALFTASGSWASDNKNVSSGYCGNLMLYGPFVKMQQLNYSRTIQPHDFVIVKFFFARIGWTARDAILFYYSLLGNDTSKVLLLDYVGDGNLSNSNSTALTPLCNNKFIPDADTKDDMISKVEIKFFQRRASPSELLMSFQPKMELTENAAWGLNSFLVLTGLCHKSCFTCNYDASPIGCLTCSNLLAQASNKSCSLCLDGFYYESESSCGRCPITCLRCQNTAGRIDCTACPQNFALKNGACEYQTNNYKIAELQLSEKAFEFTFFSITPAPSQVITTCGAYSMVGGLGVTSANSILTRIYQSLSPHVSLAVRFNLYKVDRVELSGRVQVYIDGQLLLNSTVPFTGTSQECGQPNVDTIATIESQYLSHTKEKNVNLTIRADFSAWGVRDLMLSINNCGPNCADCGPQGCRACSGFMRLQGVTCMGCIEGFVADGPTKCAACKLSCLTCDLKSTNCTSCFTGFTLIGSNCLPNPNIFVLGQQLTNLDQTSSIAVTNWTYYQPNFDSNAYNCSNLTMRNISVLNAPPKTFLVSGNTMRRNYSELPLHYKKRVRYLAMRVDDWQTDTLALFLNDLLVLNDNFSDPNRGGSSNLCGVPVQNEYIVRRQTSMVDFNQTLTVQFQVMRQPNSTRYFGVRDWLVMLQLCQQCSSLDFSYSVDYSVTNQITAMVRFNRPVMGYAYNLTFQDIFKVYLESEQYSYRLEQWSNRLFALKWRVKESIPTIVNGKLRVVCSYPTAVLTNSPQGLTSIKAVNVTGSINNYLKYLDSNRSEVVLSRYNKLEAPAAEGCRSALDVIGKIIVYGGLLSFFIGWQSVFTGPLHNLQRLWLHIYIATNYLPSNFKTVLSGLKVVQNLPFLPIATQNSIMQHLLPSNYVSQCPVAFTQYFRDVSFARNVYHVVIFAIFITVFFTLLIVLYRTVRWMRTSKAWIYVYYGYITNRPYWLFDSLVYFQYVTVMYACFAQFMDKASHPPATSLNLAAAIIALLFGVAWPIAQMFYLKVREADPNFAYHYSEVYLRFFQSKHQFFKSFGSMVYQYYRWLELLLVVILAVAVRSPSASLGLLLVLFLMHFIWLVGKKLYTEQYKAIYYLKLCELVCFVALEIVILVCCSKYETLDKAGYDHLGTAAIAFTFLIVICCFCRVLHGLYRKVTLLFDIPQPEWVDDLDQQLDTINP